MPALIRTLTVPFARTSHHPVARMLRILPIARRMLRAL